MNHIYRLVWNNAVRAWQPVSEFAAQARGGMSSAGLFAPVRWQRHALAVALALGLTGWNGTASAQVACTPSGPNNVTCNLRGSPMTPGYTNSANDLTVTLTSNGTVSSPVSTGGPAMSLGGHNITVDNSGTIDPYALSSLLPAPSTGLELTGSTAGTNTITNRTGGFIGGASGEFAAAMPSLNGLALVVRNGTGGVTTITNEQGAVIRAQLNPGTTRTQWDAPVIVTYGGANATITNSGQIVGRVAMAASGTPGGGSTFINAGSINGSVWMGASPFARNTFIVRSGSSVTGTGNAAQTVTGEPSLLFAQPGVVDGGGGFGGTLVLEDPANVGSNTDVSNKTYLNFKTLNINSGNWTLKDGSLVQPGGFVTISGGKTLLEVGNAFGNGAIDVAGGAIGSTTALTISNNITMGTGGLTTVGSNALTLSGVLSGAGGLTVDDTSILTLTNAGNNYNGTTTIKHGATLVGSANTLRGDIVNNGALTFDQDTDGTFSGMTAGSGATIKAGTGKLTLTGTQSTTGPIQINGGTLAIGSGGILSSNADVMLASSGTLDISASGPQAISSLSGAGAVELGSSSLALVGDSSTSYGGIISGSGSLAKSGTGTLTLTGVNAFTGGLSIADGTVKLDMGGSLAANTPVEINGGAFDISRGADQTLAFLSGAGGEIKLGDKILTLAAGSYDGTISGDPGQGALRKTTSGVLELNGVNTYGGGTVVTAGTLMVGGASANSTARISSDVSVLSGGAIGGFGKVDGNVTVASGARLAPGASGGVFTINGNLTLAQDSILDYSFGAPGSDYGTPGAGHSVSVQGNLNLNGARLNALDGGGFGSGLYRLFDYTGTLTMTNGGITLSTPGQILQASATTKQLSLINLGNQELAIWNADRLASPTQMGGGSGTWSATNADWTNATGSLTGTRYPADAFSIFGGAAGTVTIENTAGVVQAKGMQFASDGYRLNGDPLTLVAPAAGQLSEVRVGDGGASSAGWTTIIDNVLTGNGLNKTGAGTLVLNDANTYTQGTRLSAGTLSVSSNANLGDAFGGLDFQGGTLRVTGTAMRNLNRDITWGAAGGGFDIADAGNTFSVNALLTGNGGLNKLGAGTLVLTNNNTYTGTTRVASGTLQLGNGGSYGSIAGDAIVQAGATLAFNRSGSLVYGGTLSGAGELRKQGEGTLILTGNNTLTGVTRIDGGTLQIGNRGNTGSLTGDIVNNGELLFRRSDNWTYAGSLSGSGATGILGDSTLTLLGNSSAYTGTLTVYSDSALQVEGKLGGTVKTSVRTVLSGTGTLNNVVLTSGILAPGNAARPMGTMKLRGDLSFGQYASYRVAASADGQHSSVQVGGKATLAGSVVHVGANGSYAPSTTYTILTADGGVQGRFGKVSSNLAFLNPTLAYDDHRVDLVIKTKEVPTDDGGTRPIEFADAGNTSNQRAVARALQSLPKDSPLYRRVMNLPNGAPAGAFDGLSGETHSTSATMLQGAANTFVQVPMTRLRANLNAGMLPGVPTAQLGLGDAAALPQAAAQPLWAQVFGNWGTMRGDGNAAKTTQTDSGITIGGDHAIGGGWRLGGALGYTNSRSSTGERGASAKADSYSLTIYGGKAFDLGSAKLNFSLGTAYTWHDMSTRRNTDAAGLPQTLEASYRGNTAQVFTELGYAIPVTERVTLEPFVGAGYSSLRTRAFTESGGDAALRGDSNRNNVATTTLGLHARSVFESAGARGQVHGTLGWRHAYGDVNPASTLSFVQGGGSFTANGVPVARDAALVELGVNMDVSKRTTVGVTYGGQFGSGNRQHTGTLDVRYRY